jgi:hypothetical protein
MLAGTIREIDEGLLWKGSESAGAGVERLASFVGLMEVDLKNISNSKFRLRLVSMNSLWLVLKALNIF